MVQDGHGDDRRTADAIEYLQRRRPPEMRAWHDDMTADAYAMAGISA